MGTRAGDSRTFRVSNFILLPLENIVDLVECSNDLLRLTVSHYTTEPNINSIQFSSAV